MGEVALTVEQCIGEHVTREGLTEGGQQDATEAEQGAHHGHLAKGEASKHGSIEQASAGGHRRVGVDDRCHVAAGHAQRDEALAEHEAKLLQARIQRELQRNWG